MVFITLCSWNYIFFQVIEIKTFVVVIAVLLLMFNFKLLINKSAWASPGRFGDTWRGDTLVFRQQGRPSDHGSAKAMATRGNKKVFLLAECV